MPRIGTFPMTGWTGALLMPTAKGPRMSTIRTSALAVDAAQAVLLTTSYCALVNAGSSVEVQPPGDTTFAGVRVASVTITALRKVKVRRDADGTPRTYEVDATWGLVA